MADRLVVLIENDPVLSERIRAVLAAYHLRVELIQDGNELTLRRDLEPALTILCIDPKRLGWAICNKIKKAPQYRGVPMIVTSQEATEKDFEDHKKLKTRAEEYLHKPFGVEILLEKVASLIGLDPPQMEDSGLEEIPIDDASLIEEEDIVAEPAAPAAERTIYDPEAAQLLAAQPYIDDQIAEETDAAFAAISAAPRATDPPQGRGAVSLPGVAPRAEVPRAASLSQPLSPQPVSQPAQSGVHEMGDDVVELGFEDVVTTGIQRNFTIPQRAPEALDDGRVKELQEELSKAQKEVERWHDERDNLASERDRAEAQKRQAEAEAQRLREERDRFRADMDELRKSQGAGAPPSASTAFSREREYLNLREVINKKDKEVLDLRDALDSKERQILDARDKTRELERTRRDLDERLLEVEREFVAAREKIEALQHDKDRGIEREKGLKARLDDAQRKLVRADEEIDGWKKRLEKDVARLEELLQQEKAGRQAEVDALKAAGAEALQRAKEEAGDKEARLLAAHGLQLRREQEAHEAQVSGQRAEHEAQVAQLKEQRETQVAELEERLRETTASLQAAREAALSEQKAAYEARLEEERRAAARALEEAERRHGAELQAAGEAHAAQLGELEAGAAEALREADRRRAEELAQARAEAARALEAERARAAAELAALKEGHAGETQRLKEGHAGEAQRLRESHAGEVQNLKEGHEAALASLSESHEGKVAALLTSHEGKVAALLSSHAGEKEQLLAAHKGQMDELTQVLSAERDEALQRLADRERDLAHSRTRLAETEAALQSLQRRHGEQGAELEATQRTSREREERIAGLSRENGDFQEQLLRAYQRIKSDENLVARAKKAMAIALTLLDESGAPVPGGPGPGTSGAQEP